MDIMLPDRDGLSVLKDVRAEQSTAKLPVIMVTAKTSEMDKVKGLDQGADDYMTKPWNYGTNFKSESFVKESKCFRWKSHLQF